MVWDISRSESPASESDFSCRMNCEGTRGMGELSVNQGCSKSQLELFNGLDSGGYLAKSWKRARLPFPEASDRDDGSTWLHSRPAVAHMKANAARTTTNLF